MTIQKNLLLHRIVLIVIAFLLPMALHSTQKKKEKKIIKLIQSLGKQKELLASCKKKLIDIVSEYHKNEKIMRAFAQMFRNRNRRKLNEIATYLLENGYMDSQSKYIEKWAMVLKWLYTDSAKYNNNKPLLPIKYIAFRHKYLNREKVLDARKNPIEEAVIEDLFRAHPEEIKNWVQSKLLTSLTVGFWLEDEEQLIYWLVLGSKSNTKRSIVPPEKITTKVNTAFNILLGAEDTSLAFHKNIHDDSMKSKHAKLRESYEDFQIIKVLMAILETDPDLREGVLKTLFSEGFYLFTLYYLTIDKNGPQLSLKDEIASLEPAHMINFLKEVHNNKKRLARKENEDQKKEVEDNLNKIVKLLREKILINPTQLEALQNYVLPKQNDGSLDWEKIRWQDIPAFMVLPEISDQYEQYMRIPVTQTLEKIKNLDEHYPEQKVIEDLIRVSHTNFQEALRTVFPTITVPPSNHLKINWQDVDFSEVHWENLHHINTFFSKEELINIIIPGFTFDSGSFISDNHLEGVKWNEVKWDALADFARKSHLVNFSFEDQQVIAKQVFPNMKFNRRRQETGGISLTTDTSNIAWGEITHFKVANWLIDKGLISKEDLAQVPASLVTEKLSNATEGTPEAIFWKQVKNEQKCSNWGIWAFAAVITSTAFAGYAYLLKKKKLTYKTGTRRKIFTVDVPLQF
ncbi:MAG: hypothetical protein AAF335_00775 [Bacteroidota bacterium]